MNVMLPTYKPVLTRVNPIHHDGKKYIVAVGGRIYSKRFDKWVDVHHGMESDGATGAFDLKDSWSWLVHDKLCDACCWEDLTPCTAEQASQLLSDILHVEGYEIRRYTWEWATFLFGSWKLKRKVGWV